MKVLVLSDSHGNVNNMVQAVKRENPDMIIHLGDCLSDAEQLHKKYPNIPMERVPGNCDCSMDVPERVLLVEGKRIFILHGHTRNVKYNYLALSMAAMEKEANLVLFGHTHRVFYDFHNGIQYMNPGSIGAPGRGNPPSYGVLELDENSEKIEQNICYLE